jgi:hypothetical protein
MEKIIKNMKKTKKLYYEEEGGEFYLVTETDKTFLIEWVAHYNCDDEKTPLDQNVEFGYKLKVLKEKNKTHCLASYNDNHILIYPNQAGQPFYLELAKEEHIVNGIKDCIQWGVSSAFYENLKHFL